MRIGIDARLWNETGVGRYIRMLFKYLPKDQEFVWFLGKKEFAALEMPSKWKKVLATPHWHTIFEQILMPLIFYKENLDLLHIPYVNFPLFYFKKAVSTIHDLIPDHYKTGRASTLPFWFYPIKKFGYHFLVWMATRQALKIFTLSRDAKNEIINHYKVNPEKIVPAYESGELEEGESPDLKIMKRYQPYLLYVGNAHPHKNVENLIKAMDYLPELKLVLIGDDPFFYPRLSKHSRVMYIGQVPNHQIAGWYKCAEALVSASKMEGFGIPPLEAMSVGCPVIISDIPVFHEIDGPAAEYFDHLDPVKIASKIEEVLADKKRLKEMVELGYKQSGKYSWKKMTRSTYKTYIESFRT